MIQECNLDFYGDLSQGQISFETDKQSVWFKIIHLPRQNCLKIKSDYCSFRSILFLKKKTDYFQALLLYILITVITFYSNIDTIRPFLVATSIKQPPAHKDYCYSVPWMAAKDKFDCIGFTFFVTVTSFSTSSV